jgi:hypothetical protein
MYFPLHRRLQISRPLVNRGSLTSSTETFLPQNLSNYALLRFVQMIQKYHCSNLVRMPKYLVRIRCFPPPHLEGISGCCDRFPSLSQSVRQNAKMLSCTRLCELPPTLFGAHHFLSSCNVFSYYVHVPYTASRSSLRTQTQIATDKRREKCRRNISQ